jgi:N5-(cytidine 5'-diphosphoramidyl)-L-glutamine hydrolase
MIKRIGLTMRVIETLEYKETRDAISHDWISYLGRFPDVLAVPLPNIGKKANVLIEALRLDGLILSNGNDIGAAPIRDETEESLVETAIKTKLPVVGVCRGFQFLQHYLGGKLTRVDSSRHVSTRHTVKVLDSRFGPNNRYVNSFHNWGIAENNLASDLTATAITEDGFVEAFTAEKFNFVGIQWHPERSESDFLSDNQIIAGALNLNLPKAQ